MFAETRYWLLIYAFVVVALISSINPSLTREVECSCRFAIMFSLTKCATLVALASAHLGLAKDDGKQPNIVFILTDDQDLHMDSLNYMPLLDKYITQKGTNYGRHYCTTAICCPARASILTGKMAHNHNVTDTAAPFGMIPILNFPA